MDSLAAPILPKPEPPPKPLPFWKFIRAARDNNLATIPASAYLEPILEFKVLWFRGFILSDPEGIGHVLLDKFANYAKAEEDIRLLVPMIGNGLFTSEGETWRAHRRIMAPAFDSRSLALYAPVVTDVAAALAESWAALPAGTVVDVAASMMQATLQVVSRTMFSTDSDGIIEIVRTAFEHYVEHFPVGLIDLVPFFGPWRARRLMQFGRDVFARFDAAYERIAMERSGAPGEGPNDLLHRLIAARDEESGSVMSAREVRDQVATIFLAGHETTAQTLTWVLFLLSRHPAEEARLHAELDLVLDGRLPTLKDLPLLPYTRRVIEEAMRLYPPVSSLPARKALADDIVCGQRIAKGTIIGIHPWVVHRHHRLWDDPDRFDPERFTPERVAARPRFAYLPFGGGPRICIGAAFAMNEAMLILATLAQRFRLRLERTCRVEPQAVLTLRPRWGMKMVLEPRRAG
jgi:cytochrome P450